MCKINKYNYYLPYTNPHVWENNSLVLDRSKPVSDSELKYNDK